jgi:hypothetical protein
MDLNESTLTSEDKPRQAPRFATIYSRKAQAAAGQLKLCLHRLKASPTGPLHAQAITRLLAVNESVERSLVALKGVSAD